MRKHLDQYLGYFLALLMLIISLTVLWGVFTRYALGSQASWTEELARFLLIWIGILGAGWVSGQRQHLAITLLPERLEGRARRRLQRCIDGLVLLFALSVLVAGGLRLLYITHQLGQVSPALQVPMTVVYAVLPLSGLLIAYYKLADLKNSAKWK